MGRPGRHAGARAPGLAGLASGKYVLPGLIDGHLHVGPSSRSASCASQLYVWGDDNVAALTFYDQNDNVRVQLEGGGRKPSLELRDANKKGRLLINVNAQGRPGVSLYERDSAP